MCYFAKKLSELTGVKVHGSSRGEGAMFLASSYIMTVFLSLLMSGKPVHSFTSWSGFQGVGGDSREQQELGVSESSHRIVPSSREDKNHILHRRALEPKHPICLPTRTRTMIYAAPSLWFLYIGSGLGLGRSTAYQSWHLYSNSKAFTYSLPPK